MAWHRGIACQTSLEITHWGRDKMTAIWQMIFSDVFWISNKVSLNCVHQCLIDSTSALVQIMAWLPTGDKPLSEPMMGSLPTYIYICVPRPQWVKHTGLTLLFLVVVWYFLILPTSFRVTSLAPGQSYDCPSASEVTLKDMGIWFTNNLAKHGYV